MMLFSFLHYIIFDVYCMLGVNQMERNHQLILGYSEKVPEMDPDEETILIDIGLEDHELENIIPFEVCSYMTTFASKRSDLDSALMEIAETWLEWTGNAIYLELLTNDPTRMTKDQIDTFEQLDLDEWSYRKPFVVFRTDNIKAQKEAKKLVRDAATKSKWHFWK